MQDDYRHQGLRRKLVQLLEKKGIYDEAVLKAIQAVPRHLFFDPAFLDHAYQDKAFPIGLGQTISQPYTVAFQTMLAQVGKGDKVLEVGTGSGYQAAVLHTLGVELFTIEYLLPLQQRAMTILENLGYSGIHYYHGDGSLGLESCGPFDSIIVTAGAPSVPDALLKQLTPGGRLVIPVGGNNTQTMQLHTLHANGDVSVRDYPGFAFVPLVGKQGWG